MGIILSVISILLLITEMVLQLYFIINVFQNNLTIFCVTATVIALPFLISNIISAILVLKTMNFTGKKCGKLVCVLLHVCQLSLIWRFFKLLLLFDERDWYEFINLCLIHTSLQSLPFIIFTGFTIFFYMDLNINSTTIVLATVAILSSAITMTTFNIGKQLFESEEFLERKAKLKKHIGIFLLIMGTALLLISRCGSIILLSSIQTYWVLIPLGFHFLAYVIATVAYNCAKNSNFCHLIIQKFLLAYPNIFDLLDTNFTKIQCTYVLYYAAILVENISMTAVWLIFDNSGYVLKLMTVVVILMSFLVGMILKFGSCGLIFPESADALADSSTCSERLSKHLNKSETIIKSQERYMEPINQPPDDTITEIQYHQNSDLYDLRNSNIYDGKVLHKYQNAAFQMDDEIDYKISKPIVSPQARITDDLSCKASLHIEDTEIKVQSSLPHQSTNISLFQYSVESNDMASSNSRITNTINHGSKTHTDLQDSNYTKKINNCNANYTFPRIRNPPTDRFVQHNEGLHEQSWIKQTNLNFKSSGKQPHFRFSCKPSLDYFPESNSETVSVTDYFTDNDYFNSMEWSSSDSDYATTWPPSNQHSSNLHSLPKGKISKHDNIRLWLRNLPSHNIMFTEQASLYSESSKRNRKPLPQLKQKWYKHLKPKKVLSNLCGVGFEPFPKLFAAEMETQISESSLPFRKPVVKRWQPADTLVVSNGILESVV